MRKCGNACATKLRSFSLQGLRSHVLLDEYLQKLLVSESCTRRALKSTCQKSTCDREESSVSVRPAVHATAAIMQDLCVYQTHVLELRKKTDRTTFAEQNLRWEGTNQLELTHYMCGRTSVKKVSESERERKRQRQKERGRSCEQARRETEREKREREQEERTAREENTKSLRRKHASLYVLRSVAENHRNHIAPLHSPSLKGRTQLAAAGMDFRPGTPCRPMYHRNSTWKRRRSTR